MIVVGLTGSIGMGKTTAAGIFRQLGIPVFDSDACIRKITAKHGEAVKDVIAQFPDAWNVKNRTIDRVKLAELVFNNPDERKRLEDVLHPYVWKHQENFKKQMQRQRQPIIAMDIPLLFETGSDKRVDVTVVVSAPPYIQHQRVMAREGMTHEKFEAILNSQVPDSVKRQMADYVVPTGLGRAETTRHLKAIVHDLRASLEPNDTQPLQ